MHLENLTSGFQSGKSTSRTVSLVFIIQITSEPLGESAAYFENRVSELKVRKVVCAIFLVLWGLFYPKPFQTSAGRANPNSSHGVDFRGRNFPLKISDYYRIIFYFAFLTHLPSQEFAVFPNRNQVNFSFDFQVLNEYDWT